MTFQESHLEYSHRHPRHKNYSINHKAQYPLTLSSSPNQNPMPNQSQHTSPFVLSPWQHIAPPPCTSLILPQPILSPPPFPRLVSCTAQATLSNEPPSPSNSFSHVAGHQGHLHSRHFKCAQIVSSVNGARPACRYLNVSGYVCGLLYMPLKPRFCAM
jgi:hypothetical protein